MRTQVLVGLLLAATILALWVHTHNRQVVCSNFWSHQQAQEFFIDHSAHRLDRDRDGVACEHLP